MNEKLFLASDGLIDGFDMPLLRDGLHLQEAGLVYKSSFEAIGLPLSVQVMVAFCHILGLECLLSALS